VDWLRTQPGLKKRQIDLRLGKRSENCFRALRVIGKRLAENGYRSIPLEKAGAAKLGVDYVPILVNVDEDGDVLRVRCAILQPDVKAFSARVVTTAWVENLDSFKDAAFAPDARFFRARSAACLSEARSREDARAKAVDEVLSALRDRLAGCSLRLARGAEESMRRKISEIIRNGDARCRFFTQRVETSPDDLYVTWALLVAQERDLRRIADETAREIHARQWRLGAQISGGVVWALLVLWASVRLHVAARGHYTKRLAALAVCLVAAGVYALFRIM